MVVTTYGVSSVPTPPCPDCGHERYDVTRDGLSARHDCANDDCDRERPVRDVVEGPTP